MVNNKKSINIVKSKTDMAMPNPRFLIFIFLSTVLFASDKKNMIVGIEVKIVIKGVKNKYWK